MELVNGIQDYRNDKAREGDRLAKFAVATVVRLLFPFTPHVACELWSSSASSPTCTWCRGRTGMNRRWQRT